MRRLGYALWAAGVALLIVLIIGSGAGKVASSVERAGAGILVLLAWKALPLLTGPSRVWVLPQFAWIMPG